MFSDYTRLRLLCIVALSACAIGVAGRSIGAADPAPGQDAHAAPVVAPAAEVDQVSSMTMGPVARDGVMEVLPRVEDIPDPVVGPAAMPDGRVDAVRRILAGRPLEPWSEAIVEAADRYRETDPLMMAAISVWESGGGSYGPAAAVFNAWGIIYVCPGPAHCLVGFGSWEEGIETAARMLSSARYAGLSVQEKLCMWQSGKGDCSRDGSLEYAARVMATMESAQ